MCDARIYNQMLDQYRREHRLAQTLLELIVREHYDHHEGAIRFCPLRVCQLAATHHHAA